MKSKEVRVFEIQSYDRYIFVTFENDRVVGINFHQGIGDLDYTNFSTPNKIITAIYNDLCGDREASVHLYNESCERYLSAMMHFDDNKEDDNNTPCGVCGSDVSLCDGC